MKYQPCKMNVMYFEMVRVQDEVNHELKTFLALAEKLKEIWNGVPMSEEEKNDYVRMFKPSDDPRYYSPGKKKKYEMMQKQQFVRVDVIALKGCIVLLRECLDKLECK